ncbi:transcriptional regulator [Bacillus sp. MB353a]|uniref:helix-turn-helix domain-containing protein n=1 Tax=Bacillus sp. MB353a TaxID=1982041 RepID=UPI000B52BED2|nr:helix-turn-helix domain-containing protein [Bacillus sp. MB353a]OWW07413.1 transcriptional regulator [Bacillus sp. MB353a]
MKISTFGKEIKELRKSNKFTQKQLAEKLGKAESTIRMWELGTNTPNAKTIAELSKVLNVGYTDLMIKAGFINEEDVNLTPEEKAASDETSYLMNVNELKEIENKLKQCDSEEEKKELNARKIRLEKRISKLKLRLTEIQQRRYINPFDLMTPEEEDAYFEKQNKAYEVEDYRRREYPDIKDFLEQRNVYFNGKSLSKENRELAIKMLDVLFEKLEVNYPSEEKIEKEYNNFENMFAFLKKESSDRTKGK